MNNFSRVLIIVFILFVVKGSNLTEEAADPIDIALGKVGLTRETANFESFSLRKGGGEELSLGIFLGYLNNPLKVPYLLGHFKKNYLDHKDSLHDTLMYMTGRVGEGVSRGYKDSEPLKDILEKVKEKDALEGAFKAIYSAAGENLGENAKNELRKEMEKVPEEIRKDLALVLYTCASSLKWHERAFRDVQKYITPELRQNINYMVLRKETNVEIKHNLEKLIREVDYRFLYTGMLDIAEAIDKASEGLREFKPTAEFTFRFSTPLGLVIVSSAGDEVYDSEENYLLIIDYRGDDKYSGGGADKAIEKPISILLDFQGDDAYECMNENEPSFGSGLFGYGFLLDYEGNDTYIGKDMTQGCGILGVGALIDYRGNDAYAARSTAQASAQFGLGLFMDMEGRDMYYSLTASQAYAGPKGHSLLVDQKGDDRYVLDDYNITLPSPQTKKHNKSEGQGFGSGMRSDLLDGHSVAGGVAILWDIEGNDEYSAGVFAQGAGFWHAAGILIDSQGNDSYKGAWYVQGSGVHNSVGVLMDEAGDDRYSAKLYAAQGIGHDFSLGMLVDRKGNDIYRSPSLALGVGNDNGIGMLLDVKGNDIYITDETMTFGYYRNTKMGTLREDRLNLGLFFDLAGDDSYPKKSRAKNDYIWVQEKEHPECDLPFEKAVGLDGEYPSLRLDFEPKTK